ncbi:MAG: 4Fe-4S dicluster domain-containing protein [Deltaproteobacteria bacterium]|nr:4Fe-4S dicluster domain-containing protein [Deltaproteobacteria bacterium]
MHPTWMLIVLLGFFGAFCWSANRRWQLLKIGRPAHVLGRPVERLWGTLVYAFGQKRLGYYPLAGLAHKLIFFGFLVLLLRSLVLWGRGLHPGFNFWILGPEDVLVPWLGASLGHLYDFAKDAFGVLVLLGAVVFLYYRLVRREPRMSHSGEALLILAIIVVMMLADMSYDGAAEVLHRRHLQAACGAGAGELCTSVQTVVAHLGPTAGGEIGWQPFPAPAGSLFATVFSGLGAPALVVLAHAGFWTHAVLVLLFLNILPFSKHFHVITSIPNVFLRELGPPGRLAKMADGAEQLGEIVMKAADDPAGAPPVGIARIEHFTWKQLLDFYSCTECGRCSEGCPAHTTGKLLSPKQLTIDLRDHLYGRMTEFLHRPGGPQGLPPETHGHEHEPGAEPEAGHGPEHEHGHEPERPDNPVPIAEVKSEPIDLVSQVIHPDVLWGCTTCRSCEVECPVLIGYVDKIVDLRRHQVLIRGEFPPMLAGPFQGMEVNGNPWDLSRLDRAAWAEGLPVPTFADKPQTPVLLWVGCAASFDDRAKKIARATAKLLLHAGVDFAILGQEESCTGDAARRAGNEYLFVMLAEQNVKVLNGYKEQGGIARIVTICPHCYNTLRHEYPDFGGQFEVVHHSELLLSLLREGKLVPRKRIGGRVVFHDSCYLGRYNDIYAPPRELLRAIPGLELCEVPGASHERGLCCGAGGAQMWMEEQNRDRMNVRRTRQLLDTGAKTIASACPFCVTMITDGLKDQEKEDEVRQLDIAELLEQSCDLGEPAGEKPAVPQS